MRSKWLLMIVAAVVLVGLSGCATVIKPVPAQDLNPKVKSGALVQKTNNFEVIMDTSASMDEPYKWNHFAYTSPMQTTVLEYEQHLVRLFNDTIPNLKLTAGLRDFAGRRVFSRPFDTKLWYGMSPWAKEDLEKSIYAVNTGGVESPLDLAIDAATMDLKPLAGKSALIIFSDGLEMPKAVASAQAMKAAMKDNICIYVVQVGPDKITPDWPQGEGKALLDKVVKAGECGALVNAKDVETAAGMGAFVEKIFLRTCPSASSRRGACRGSARGSPCSGRPGYARGDLLRVRQVRRQARVPRCAQAQCRVAPEEPRREGGCRGQLRRARDQRVQHGPGPAQGGRRCEVPDGPGHREGPGRHGELRRGEARLYGKDRVMLVQEQKG